MTVVLNNPSWWPLIDLNVFLSYWTVAAGVVVIYDWVLTLGQEIELIWRQRWSLMTLLYLVIRYVGIPFSVAYVLSSIPLMSLTDAVSNITNYIMNVTNVVIAATLGIVMIARLYAMYQGSRMMLIFLVIIFLAVNIACGVIAGIVLKHFVGDEWIMSGTYMCNAQYEGDGVLLISMVWVLNTVWEILALCLSVWIAVKHFRNLRRLGPSTGSKIGDYFRVLIQSHVLYFASFVCVSCLQIAFFFPELQNSHSTITEILEGALQILLVVQMFVLGPRLILSVRQCHAKLVAGSDLETRMNLIVFQDRVHVSTSITL
ncbi:uncharacterized protein HD556DRAFT_196940 [Suillus plorans]|uniref:DUF6533 domain-containing protein n=1 Tax=Suillus plorans TaxID=116603 RepID=A0A9P7DMT3_9AGAM|nr:uncharacterized protein HD556DRAFT_196940 [Suillus plorans]KAG1798643.1 hypothetical protein HD556DRAFT_196940 [Suillus plorans]